MARQDKTIHDKTNQYNHTRQYDISKHKNAKTSQTHKGQYNTAHNNNRYGNTKQCSTVRQYTGIRYRVTQCRRIHDKTI